jgi:glycosyltransferase involved in cell wall biosynthesis
MARDRLSSRDVSGDDGPRTLASFEETGPEDRAAVTVVIPCYRCAKTVARAVDSVLAQTRLPQEIVLVDDGSDDNRETLTALQLLKQRCRDTVRLVVLSLDANAGPGAARNAGWDVATQPYIAFLDADDSWHPEKLKLQYAWMARRTDVVLTFTRTSVWDGNTASVDVHARLPAHRVGLSLLMANQIATRSVLVRRDIPFRFAPGKRYAEDYLLWLQVLLGGGQLWQLDVPLALSYKPAYGDAGLSADLWRMEVGELSAYRELVRQGLLSPLALPGLASLSMTKYTLRTIRISRRRRGERRRSSPVENAAAGAAQLGEGHAPAGRPGRANIKRGRRKAVLCPSAELLHGLGHGPAHAATVSLFTRTRATPSPARDSHQ